jgi:hypothetical protein
MRTDGHSLNAPLGLQPRHELVSDRLTVCDSRSNLDRQGNLSQRFAHSDERFAELRRVSEES